MYLNTTSNSIQNQPKKLLTTMICIGSYSFVNHATTNYITHLNLPILLRWENISPPPTNSNTMYRFELSYNIIHSQFKYVWMGRLKMGKWKRRWSNSQRWKCRICESRPSEKTRQYVGMVSQWCPIDWHCSSSTAS